MSSRVTPRAVWLPAVQHRIQAARAELLATDRPGSVPGVEASEAERAPTRLARQGWSAGSRLWGDRSSVSVPGGGWAPRLSPKDSLSETDLQHLENQALRILQSLTAPGSKEVPREALADLPARVDAYWSETFGAHRRLLPEQRDALVGFIRDAVEEAGQ